MLGQTGLRIRQSKKVPAKERRRDFHGGAVQPIAQYPGNKRTDAFQFRKRSAIAEKITGMFRPKESAARRFLVGARENAFAFPGFARKKLGDLCIGNLRLQNRSCESRMLI